MFDVELSVQGERTDEPPGAIRRVHALVNPASGGLGPGVADELAILFAELGVDHRVSQLLPFRFERTVRAAIDTDPDLIVVLGGDGTTRLVAELCGAQGPLVAPLCGGTMNKLGRWLYGARSWREALLGAITRGSARWVPGGEVAGHTFYCSALLGSPALWARAREAVRHRKLARAWRRAAAAYREAFVAPLDFEFDGLAGCGVAVSLICPTVSRALQESYCALETAVLDVRSTRAGVRLAFNKLFRDWRDDPDVNIRCTLSGHAWARGRIPAMLDGEFFRLGRRIDMRFRRKAFRALALDASCAAASRPPATPSSDERAALLDVSPGAGRRSR